MSDSETTSPKIRSTITVDENLCKGCGYCVNECPKQILALLPAQSRIGFNTVHIVDPEKCIRCRKCEFICPEMAIFLSSQEESSDNSR